MCILILIIFIDEIKLGLQIVHIYHKHYTQYNNNIILECFIKKTFNNFFF